VYRTLNAVAAVSLICGLSLMLAPVAPVAGLLGAALTVVGLVLGFTLRRAGPPPEPEEPEEPVATYKPDGLITSAPPLPEHAPPPGLRVPR